MTSDSVKNQITVLQARWNRLGESLEKLSVMDMTTFPKEYEGHTTDAALRAESLAYQLRQLLLITTTVKPEEYYAKANKELGIDVSFADGVFAVTLPCLLPKKRCTRSMPYLLEPLRYALLDFFRRHDRPRFRECTVHVEHVYDEQFPTSAARDYDNLQLKKVLDMITLFTMTDDTGRLCNLYQTTRLDKPACTRIYVMAKDRFVDWLKSKPQGQK